MSSQQNPSHTYAAAGPYSVKLTVSNAGGSSQTVQVITVP
jgi:PKD repeat protein